MTTAQTLIAKVDVRSIPPRERHPLIFGTFDRLAAGQALLLVNDHDPKPLFYQFQAESPGEFTWDYLESGPEVWQVKIGKPQAGAVPQVAGGCGCAH